MDAYFLVVAILVLVLIISVYYILSYSNGFGPNSRTINPQITKTKEAFKTNVSRKHVSTQSDIKPTQEVLQTVTVSQYGSDELEQINEVDDKIVNATQKCGDTFTATQEDATTKHNYDDEDTEINTFRSFVNEDKLTQCMKKQGVFRGLCNYIKDSIDDWKVKPIEIAIAGNSGTGKSSLINSLRGLTASDKGAAAVGVTETTTEPVRYEFPHTDRIFISDLPGMGTVKFPREKYFEEMEISKYDAFIIVTSGRITQDDVWFVRHVLHGTNPKHVLLLRTQIDVDLRNAKFDYPSVFKKNKCLSDIREELRSNFKNDEFKGLRKNIYLISSRKKNKFDFPRLSSKLKNMLNISGKGIRKLLEKEVHSFIDKKRDLNKGEFLGRKVAALICGFLPKQYNVLESLKEIRSICKSKFGLNEKSLQTVSEETGMDVNYLKSNMLTFKQSKVELSSLLGSSRWGIHDYQTIKINLSTTCDEMSADEKFLVDLKLKDLEEEFCPL